jgi:hypothetical protein
LRFLKIEIEKGIPCKSFLWNSRSTWTLDEDEEKKQKKISE